MGGWVGLGGGRPAPTPGCVDKAEQAPFDPSRGGASDEQEDFAMKVWIASAPDRSGARAFRSASLAGAGLMTLMLAIAAGSPARAQAPAPAQPAPKAQPKAAPKAAPQQPA